jgi:pimeloyl-ACP methyl ester carboxylesterase
VTTSVYKSVEARDSFWAVYNGILSTFPFEQRYVDTAYGRTFVLQAGKRSHPPAVLLHGSCSNSVFMTPELMALSATHRVYAVDIIGEAGNSDDHRPDLHSNAFALWLRDVFDALELNAAVLLGSSLGGWMSLKFATLFPERVSSLILISPGGLSGQNEKTLEKAVAMIQDPDAVESPTVTESVMGASLPKEVEDFMNLILSVYTPITDILPVFSDELLKQLTMPVLFIGGENDAILDMAGAARRLAACLPQADIRLLKAAGHAILNSAEYILPFLQKAGSL